MNQRRPLPALAFIPPLLMLFTFGLLYKSQQSYNSSNRSDAALQPKSEDNREIAESPVSAVTRRVFERSVLDGRSSFEIVTRSGLKPRKLEIRQGSRWIAGPHMIRYPPESPPSMVRAAGYGVVSISPADLERGGIELVEPRTFSLLVERSRLNLSAGKQTDLEANLESLCKNFRLDRYLSWGWLSDNRFILVVDEYSLLSTGRTWLPLEFVLRDTLETVKLRFDLELAVNGNCQVSKPAQVPELTELPIEISRPEALRHTPRNYLVSVTQTLGDQNSRQLRDWGRVEILNRFQRQWSVNGSSAVLSGLAAGVPTKLIVRHPTSGATFAEDELILDTSRSPSTVKQITLSAKQVLRWDLSLPEDVRPHGDLVIKVNSRPERAGDSLVKTNDLLLRNSIIAVPNSSTELERVWISLLVPRCLPFVREYNLGDWEVIANELVFPEVTLELDQFPITIVGHSPRGLQEAKSVRTPDLDSDLTRFYRLTGSSFSETRLTMHLERSKLEVENPEDPPFAFRTTSFDTPHLLSREVGHKPWPDSGSIVVAVERSGSVQEQLFATRINRGLYGVVSTRAWTFRRAEAAQEVRLKFLWNGISVTYDFQALETVLFSVELPNTIEYVEWIMVANEAKLSGVFEYSDEIMELP